MKKFDHAQCNEALQVFLSEMANHKLNDFLCKLLFITNDPEMDGCDYFSNQSLLNIDDKINDISNNKHKNNNNDNDKKHTTDDIDNNNVGSSSSDIILESKENGNENCNKSRKYHLLMLPDDLIRHSLHFVNLLAVCRFELCCHSTFQIINKCNNNKKSFLHNYKGFVKDKEPKNIFNFNAVDDPSTFCNENEYYCISSPQWLELATNTRASGYKLMFAKNICLNFLDRFDECIDLLLRPLGYAIRHTQLRDLTKQKQIDCIIECLYHCFRNINKKCFKNTDSCKQIWKNGIHDGQLIKCRYFNDYYDNWYLPFLYSIENLVVDPFAILAFNNIPIECFVDKTKSNLKSIVFFNEFTSLDEQACIYRGLFWDVKQAYMDYIEHNCDNNINNTKIIETVTYKQNDKSPNYYNNDTEEFNIPRDNIYIFNGVFNTTRLSLSTNIYVTMFEDFGIWYPNLTHLTFENIEIYKEIEEIDTEIYDDAMPYEQSEFEFAKQEERDEEILFAQQQKNNNNSNNNSSNSNDNSNNDNNNNNNIINSCNSKLHLDYLRLIDYHSIAKIENIISDKTIIDALNIQNNLKNIFIEYKITVESIFTQLYFEEMQTFLKDLLFKKHLKSIVNGSILWDIDNQIPKTTLEIDYNQHLIGQFFTLWHQMIDQDILTSLLNHFELKLRIKNEEKCIFEQSLLFSRQTNGFAYLLRSELQKCKQQWLDILKKSV